MFVGHDRTVQDILYLVHKISVVFMFGYIFRVEFFAVHCISAYVVGLVWAS